MRGKRKGERIGKVGGLDGEGRSDECIGQSHGGDDDDDDDGSWCTLCVTEKK